MEYQFNIKTINIYSEIAYIANETLNKITVADNNGLIVINNGINNFLNYSNYVSNVFRPIYN